MVILISHSINLRSLQSKNRDFTPTVNMDGGPTITLNLFYQRHLQVITIGDKNNELILYVLLVFNVVLSITKIS